MRKFQRTKEDFDCENCAVSVRGDGYTNHCPDCLWCKHVDINPGDRAELCHGIMKPVGVDIKNGENSIIHSCVKCGFKRKNKLNEKDNMDTFIKLMDSGFDNS